METSVYGQITYRAEADALIPGGCVAVGNEHGACMGRGCKWCLVYYYGPAVLDELLQEGEEDPRTGVPWVNPW